MVVRWPAKIKHDDQPRDAFLHLVDVVPTILEAANVPMPDTVNGIKQKRLVWMPEWIERLFYEVFQKRPRIAGPFLLCLVGDTFGAPL